MVATRKPDPRARRARESADSAEAAFPRTVYTLSEQETFDLGRTVARGLRAGDLVLLQGDLGLGKTVFVRGVAAGLGLPPEDVTSPSFALIQEYRGGALPLFHADLYRLDDPDAMTELGLDEILASGAVLVVEWGEKLPPPLRRDAILVRLHDVGEDSRRIELDRTVRPGRVRRGDA